MPLPTFQLETPIAKIALPGKMEWTLPHETAKNAIQRQNEIAEGHVVLTDWNGLLHEIIYQTPLEGEEASSNRNEFLFSAYRDGHTWNEILDNGFGKTYPY